MAGEKGDAANQLDKETPTTSDSGFEGEEPLLPLHRGGV